MAAHLGLAHVPFQFGLGYERGHGIHHHHVHSPGTNQKIGDLQGLFPVIRLGNKQFLGIDPQFAGISHIHGVFRIDKRGHAALFLGLGDYLQGQGGLARGFRAVDLGDPPPGDSAYSQGDIQADGPGGNGRYGLMCPVGQAHDRSLAVFALNGPDGSFQGLFLHIFRAHA